MSHNNTIPKAQAANSTFSENFDTVDYDVACQQTNDPANSELVKKMKALEERLRALENQHPEQRKKKVPEDRELKKIILEALRLYSGDFNFELNGMLADANKGVVDAVRSAVLESHYCKTNICSPDGHISYDTEKQIKAVCRARYDALRRKWLDQKNPVVLEKRRIRSNKNSRRTRKLARRKATFSSCKGLIASCIEKSVKECEQFLIPECMSEEEDNELYNNSTRASSFKILTPSWRSDNLNRMFTLLDKIYSDNSKHLTEFKSRVHEPVFVEAPPIVDEKNGLPAWGVQDACLNK